MAYYHYSLAHMYQEMAITYNRQDYVTKAIDHLRQAMKFDPASSFLPVELAEIYERTGRTTDAISEAEDLVRRDPKNVDARRLLGRIYLRGLSEPGAGNVGRGMQQGDLLKRALDQFQKIVEIDPKDVDSLLALGRLYRFSNDSPKAEAAFKKALAVDPGNDETLVTLAELYSDLGETKQATELLERAAEHNQHPRLLAMLGASYESNHQYAKAIEVFKRALEQDKENLDLKRSLGQSLLQNDQLDEALKIFQGVAEADPQDPNSYLRIGQIYQRKRNYPKALESFKKAMALDPSNVEVIYNVATLHETQGSYDEATRLMRKLVDDSTKPAGSEYTAREKANRGLFLERLASLYRIQDKFKEAEAALRQMIEMDPDNAARAYMSVVETLRQARDYTRARQEADAMVKKFPDDKSVRLARATLVADLGKVDEGLAEVKQLLNGKKSGNAEQDNDERREMYFTLAHINENARRFDEALAAAKSYEGLSSGKEQEEQAHFLYGSIYERAKRIDDAERSFRKVLALNPDSATTMNYLGYMLADHGARLDEAVKLIVRALEIDPQNGAYMDSLGWAYYKQNRMDLAEQ